jgi:drug/metabolite transporter (DMT)-like permease
VLGYLEPLSAVILAAALLHESLAPIQVVGGALILGGALFSESFARARLKSRPSITRAAPALRKPPRQG